MLEEQDLEHLQNCPFLGAWSVSEGCPQPLQHLSTASPSPILGIAMSPEHTRPEHTLLQVQHLSSLAPRLPESLGLPHLGLGL